MATLNKLTVVFGSDGNTQTLDFQVQLQEFVRMVMLNLHKGDNPVFEQQLHKLIIATNNANIEIDSMEMKKR